MLTIGDYSRPFGRRDFLRIGGLSLGGMTLGDTMARRLWAAESSGLLKDKCVILLFLHGGPSQIETFDPKMTAPAGIHSDTGEVATTIPGITFGGTFGKLAKLAHKFTVVRSYVTGDGNHDIKPAVGRESFGANLGSIYSRVVGMNDPITGMPTSANLFPRAVDASAQAAVTVFGRFDATGNLGKAYAPFDPSGGGELQDDMRLAIPMDRLDDRRTLLTQLDFAKRALGAAVDNGLEKTREQAFSTIVGGVADAFDLSKEAPQLVERYDTAPLVRPDQISRRWNNYNNYVDNAKTLGKLLLMARRICERGCRFVTVTTNFVWDMHADVNNAGVAEGMGYMGVPLDHAVSALIEDLEAKGLSEKIMLVACGEMGRTPMLDQNGGRNHWGALAPLLIYGGGLKMGQVIGQSNRSAGEPASNPITNQNLVASIMETMFDIGKLRIVSNLPREITQSMTSWDPIPGLH